MSKLKHVLQTEFIRHRIGPKRNIYIAIFQFLAQIIMLDKCPCFNCGLQYKFVTQIFTAKKRLEIPRHCGIFTIKYKRVKCEDTENIFLIHL